MATARVQELAVTKAEDSKGLTIAQMLRKKEAEQRLKLAKELFESFDYRFPLNICVMALMKCQDDANRASK